MHYLEHTVWSEKVKAVLELEKYETLMVDELFSKLKSSEVDRGVRAKIENLTDPHSLTHVSGPRTNANMSSRHFSLSCLVSMSDEEFKFLSEEDLALLSRRFDRMYTNRKDTRRILGMSYQCRKHRHCFVECLEAMEVKPKHKHHPRADHKHRSRMTTRARTSPSGGRGGVAVIRRRSERHRLKSYYSSLSSSDEDENRHKGKRSSKNINVLCFGAQGFCGMAHSSASKKSNKDDSNSDSVEEVNNDPSFLVA
jgi:hypothetical protein